jgi:uncharacterized protein YkwD
MGICFVSYASTITTTSTITKELQTDGSIHIKTVYNTITVHSVADIKNNLPVTSSANEKQLFKLIQEYRAQQKKPPILKYSSKLANVARGQAKYMSNNNILSHMDGQHRNAGDRMLSGGFEPSFWGEIVGEAKDADQAFNAFKNSILHNKIILDDTYSIIGVGYYQGKWVVSFYKDTKMKYADKEVATPPKLIRSKTKTSATTNSSSITTSTK